MSTSSTDAQTWVWPPAGAAVPPIAATGSFGPVNLGDSMVLEWTPATNPEIDLTCVSESGAVYTNTFAAKLASSPLTFPFKDTAKTNGTERIFCHFFFNPSVLGNTVTFEFLNEAGSKAVTWSQNKAATTSSKASSSSASTLSDASLPLTATSNSIFTTSQASTTTTSSPSPTSSTANTTPSPASGGLSPGAGAGIGIGLVVLLGLAALAFFSMRKKKRRPGAIAELPIDREYHEKDGHSRYEKRQPAFASAELEGSPTAHQLP